MCAVRDNVCDINIVIIDPFPKQRTLLEGMILKSMGNQAGRLRIRQFDGADDCPQWEIEYCQAIFLTLNSGEDVAAAHRLRSKAKKSWPLVVVTDYGRFSLDSYALWARHCLRRPLQTEQMSEALRRCIDTEY